MINQIVKVKEILSHQSGINNRVIYSHEKKRGFVKPYPTKKYKAYQKEILSQFKGEIDIEENEAVKIELLFSFKKPKSWSKKVREETKYHLTKIDVDNMAKGVMDLMAEFYNFNDKQVVELKVNKEYNEEDYNYIAIKLEQE